MTQSRHPASATSAHARTSTHAGAGIDTNSGRACTKPRALPTLRTTLITLASGALLTGCYVVPIQPQPSIYAPPQGGPVVTVPATYTARLYPANDEAARAGMLQATVTDGLNGHGNFTLTYAGEPMQGEATRVPDNHPGYGRIYQQVYGGTPRPTSGGYRKGIASAVGARGSYVNCEYALNSAALGTGACLFSNGAKYQLHFGG